MKKLVIFSVIFLLAGIINLKAQNQDQKNVYPIPSFGIPISGNATFREFGNSNENGKERRKLNIKTTSTSHGMDGNDAKVWIITGYGEVVDGPYYIKFGQVLTVPVDSGQCGAIVHSEKEALVDIWFGDYQY